MQALDRLLRRIEESSLARDRQLEQMLQRVLKERHVEAQISNLNAYKEIHSHVYQAASNYSNLIIIGGYAGFFAIWQLVHDEITTTQSFVVALLISVSLILFASFEVFKMINHSVFFRRVGRVLHTFPEQEHITAWQAAAHDQASREATVWIWHLVPTVITGFGAGFYLLWVLLSNLWRAI